MVLGYKILVVELYLWLYYTGIIMLECLIMLFSARAREHIRGL